MNANIESLRDNGPGHFEPVQVSDFHNLCWRKFARAVSVCASFCFHVLHVLRVASKPQMSRIDTERVISPRAVVKHIHALRDRAIVEHPRQDMGTYGFSPWRVSRPTSEDHPVKPPFFGYFRAMGNSTHPEPAGVCLANFAPKPFNDGGRKSLLGQILGSNVDHLHSSFTRSALQGLAELFIFSKVSKMLQGSWSGG